MAAAIATATFPAAYAVDMQAGDWTVSVGGNINAFYTNSECKQPAATVGGLAVGDATLACGGKSKTTVIGNGLLPSMLNVDVRHAYLTFGNKNMGTFKFGRDCGLFGLDIAYANAAFMRTSGFSADELMGQPHYLVHHPDMPVEAFADMWRSLKDGQSWSALVKNRRQNGDHYWVRTKPSRAEIDSTETLFSRFKAGRASGFAFHRGLIVHTGLLRWTSALQLLPPAWRVRLPLMLLGAVMGVGLSFSGLNRCDDIGLLARAINQAGLNLHSLVADVHEQAAGVQVFST